jgi:hypothetical protein
MKIKMPIAVLLVTFILASCTPTGKTAPTETVVPATQTVPAPTETTIPTPTIVSSPTLTVTPSPVPTPNPFVGYWIQTKLSDHPLGISVCGNFQNVEFFQDGTFIVTNDYSGIYKAFDFGGLGSSSQEYNGEYKILNENQIEIKYSDDNVTVWEYVFSGDALTMSSPVSTELGGGFIPCYFSKSNK